ncbi:hypothetical protein [uncultured Sphingomonas sp.]|uniref:hypothetical protein n=1 Tax=uncultured Sphingomonas sp. TaxID=158754 RepID=UPI0025FA6F34|nr:hypothetical protein [uncultured Sphingomonas sp.]
MSAAPFLNFAALALCAGGFAQAAVDATFAESWRIRLGSATIGAVSLAGVVSFMARTAALVLV